MMRTLMLAAVCGLTVASAVPGARAQTPPPPDLVFRPITPCRAFLTSTALAANQARTFVVNGTAAQFTAQGGPSAGCGIPASATAVALSLTSFASTGTGHLRATAFGDPITGTQVLSFRTNVTETAGVIAAAKTGKITIKSYTAATRIAGDVTGYYAPQISASILADGSVKSKTSRIIASAKNDVGYYSITVDQDISKCSAAISVATTFSGASGYTSGNIVIIDTWEMSPLGFADRPFNLHVSC